MAGRVNGGQRKDIRVGGFDAGKLLGGGGDHVMRLRCNEAYHAQEVDVRWANRGIIATLLDLDMI
ncbi:hypothetical protein A2U01_0066539, partial [Trifolium medium]|nr:hypothetical protein [Trifolium medium]